MVFVAKKIDRKTYQVKNKFSGVMKASESPERGGRSGPVRLLFPTAG